MLYSNSAALIVEHAEVEFATEGIVSLGIHFVCGKPILARWSEGTADPGNGDMPGFNFSKLWQYDSEMPGSSPLRGVRFGLGVGGERVSLLTTPSELFPKATAM